uniref:Uncharacterized protein n=1 Tax=Anguilla anguilla TaxID=7936 RepID=A0A0E9X0Q7_ANGAN
MPECGSNYPAVWPPCLPQAQPNSPAQPNSWVIFSYLKNHVKRGHCMSTHAHLLWVHFQTPGPLKFYFSSSEG